MKTTNEQKREAIGYFWGGVGSWAFTLIVVWGSAWLDQICKDTWAQWPLIITSVCFGLGSFVLGAASFSVFSDKYPKDES